MEGSARSGAATAAGACAGRTRRAGGGAAAAAGHVGQTNPAGKRTSTTAESHRHDTLVNDDLRPNEGRARRRFRNDRDLEARPFDLDLGVGRRDHEAPADRKLGDLGFQRSAVEVEALCGAELGHARRRRSAEAEPGAGVEREQEMARARHANRRSRGDAIARRGGARAAGRLDRHTGAVHVRDGESRRRPRLAGDVTAPSRRSGPAGGPATPRRTARRLLPRRPSRPRARRAGVRGRGARARSRRRPPSDPATCRRSRRPRHVARARARPGGRGVDRPRESSSSPFRPFELAGQLGIGGDAFVQLLAAAHQPALRGGRADRHDPRDLPQVVAVHVVQQERPGPRRDRCRRGAGTRDRSSIGAPRSVRAVQRRRARTTARPTARGARPCGGGSACKRRAPPAWRARHRAGTRRDSDRWRGRSPPSSAGTDPGDRGRFAPAGG